jgi:glutamine amidotransferase
VSRPEITVVDYGIGNLFSVTRALEYCGANVRMSSKAVDIVSADRLLLPGVGAFADGMQGLRDRDFIEPLMQFAATGRPLLGICLGMQMLATASEEFGEHPGLGLIPGRVKQVPTRTIEGNPHKIPHIGWSEIYPTSDGGWKGTILEDTAAGAPVYLVHSFHHVPENPAHLLADCDYGGHRVTAAIRSGPILGAQFHPEKSGSEGLKMMAAFLRL